MSKYKDDTDSEDEPKFCEVLQQMASKLSPSANDLVKILESCMNVNPYLRMTAEECLKFNVFDPIRDFTKEKIL